MAVESRFVVIRQGVEAKTFMDKKSADEYDKMLDMADNLADVFSSSSIALSDAIAEELSIYLAQNRDEVLVALLAKKATKTVTKKVTKKAVTQLDSQADSDIETLSIEAIEESTEEVAQESKTKKTAPKTVKKAVKKNAPVLAEAS
jgi:dsDNA-binding SOS-regulon protein